MNTEINTIKPTIDCLKTELENLKIEKSSLNQKLHNLESETTSYQTSLREHEVLKQMIPTLENQFNHELNHLKEINRQNIFKIRQAHDIEVEKLMRKHEADLVVQEENFSTISRGNQLKEEIALSKELDRQLFDEIIKRKEKYGLKFDRFQEIFCTEFGKLKELIESKYFQVNFMDFRWFVYLRFQIS